MKNKNMGSTCVAIILFVGFLISPAGAQQSATPAKPAESGSAQSTSSGTAATDSAAAGQKVVLKVGETQVTQSEMDMLVSKLGSRARVIIARRGRRPLGDEYVKTLLLSQRAIEEHLDTSPAIRSQLEMQRAQMLAEAAYQDMSRKVQVSADEVGQYFTAHQSEFETVKVREFTIRKRPKDSNDTKRGLTPEAAKAKAQAIRKALLAGTDIEKVAATYTSYPNVQLVDKRVKKLRREEMMPALAEATFAVKNEGVSEPVETPDTIYVVKVFGHESPAQKDVAEEIAGTLQQQKLDAEIEQMKKKAGVWMDEDYFSGRSLPPPKSAAHASNPTDAPKPE